MSLGRRLAAEALGTALLLATIIGSGIMGEQLAGGNTAVALLANTLATGAGLVALILAFGPVSGAHFNPLVSIAEGFRASLRWRELPLYIVVQIAGAYAGTAAAHLMFAKPLFFASQHARAGWPMVWSEVVASFGLLYVVLATSRTRPAAVPFAVGAYITAAYWFTASTSFANPAVTLARAASDTFAGIRPADVPGFLAAQAIGGAVALGLYTWLFAKRAREGIDYRPATVEDRKAIVALLDAERLPSSDLATSGVALLVAKTEGRLVGCVGIEPHGDAGIIRSLAVTPEFRGRGIARALVSRAENLGFERGIRCLYLLTEDAAEFWKKARYVVVARTEAPAAVRASAEFRSLCSPSATCMKRPLSVPMDRN